MHPAPEPPPTLSRVEVTVPFTTLLKVAAGLGLLAAVWVLRPFLALLLLALLGAVTLAPVMTALKRRGLGHGLSATLVGVAIVLAIAGFWALLLPPLTHQVSVFIEHFHEMRQSAEARTTGLAHRALVEAFNWPKSPDAKELFRHKWTLGMAVVEGLSGVVLVVILTIYLLVDGKRLYAWLLSYVPRRHRERVRATVPEVSSVVRAYVRGQIITSVICGIYAYGALTILHVPAAIPLAVLAGIFDVLPVLGFILAVVPAGLLGLTRSPTTALLVVALYVLYHAIENYLLVPKIYGKQLRLSTLTVLIAIIVGGTLGGVLGAILVLPAVAAYPIIERLWMGGYLGRETIEDHAALDHPAQEVADQAAQKVIEGRRPPGSENPDSPRH